MLDQNLPKFVHINKDRRYSLEGQCLWVIQKDLYTACGKFWSNISCGSYIAIIACYSVWVKLQCFFHCTLAPVINCQIYHSSCTSYITGLKTKELRTQLSRTPNLYVVLIRSIFVSILGFITYRSTKQTCLLVF